MPCSFYFEVSVHNQQQIRQAASQGPEILGLSLSNHLLKMNLRWAKFHTALIFLTIFSLTIAFVFYLWNGFPDAVICLFLLIVGNLLIKKVNTNRRRLSDK